MKQLLILLIALLWQTSLFAQDDAYNPLLNEELSWQIRYFFGFPPKPLSAGHYFLGEDTLINGLSYTPILGHPTYPTDESLYPNYIVDQSITYETDFLLRENVETRRVYMYDVSDSTDKLMYDFSLEVGDTLFSAFSDGEFVILEIDTVFLLNGEERKMFTAAGAEPYIESVGSLNGLQELLWSPLSGGYSSAECVKIGDELIWASGQSGSCIGFLSTSDDFFQKELSIFPNPASDHLMIDIPENGTFNSYSIFDMQGREVAQQFFLRSGNAIDISRFPKGVYFLRVSDEEGSFIQKKFVKAQ